MSYSENELLHELLKNRYQIFYLAHPRNRQTALKLHEMGYFNDEIGQVTDKGQEYFDNLYLNIKEKLLVELRRSDNQIYNQVSRNLGFDENTLYLHHFLKKLENEELLYYREGEDFSSNFRISFR